MQTEQNQSLSQSPATTFLIACGAIGRLLFVIVLCSTELPVVCGLGILSRF
ncbi:MAG TPA: hypothetical protein VF026_26490 [Ktedonobacteraceae bacterium]